MTRERESSLSRLPALPTLTYSQRPSCDTSVVRVAWPPPGMPFTTTVASVRRRAGFFASKATRHTVLGEEVYIQPPRTYSPWLSAGWLKMRVYSFLRMVPSPSRSLSRATPVGLPPDSSTRRSPALVTTMPRGRLTRLASVYREAQKPGGTTALGTAAKSSHAVASMGCNPKGVTAPAVGGRGRGPLGSVDGSNARHESSPVGHTAMGVSTCV